MAKRPEKLAKGVSLTTATKDIAAAWNKLPADGRAEWVKKSAELTKIREAKIASGEFIPKAKREKNSVKRVSGYCLFNSESMAALKKSNPSLTPPEVMRKCAAMWSQLSDAEKQVYKTKALTYIKPASPAA
ncbi:high mobility group protein B3-like protein [Perkinsela sp. CCAP 1560/4]|nr:high mobility group protein B3-like protein [Perkinsela sp. CCAP 1560/4]|eukprot:KNH09735.1 high mobility group protein B3-like protein [Perkinsela sp. CCAP 1560/4]